MVAAYQDDFVTLHCGTALDVLREMPEKSVHMCVTSPDGIIGVDKPNTPPATRQRPAALRLVWRRSVNDNISPTDLAYCAGIIDGEGYIGIKRSKPGTRKDMKSPQYNARISMRMVHEGAIRFIAETLGGWYWKEKPHSNNGRPLYAYQATDKACQGILESVLPYLLVKRESAQTVLELRRLQADSMKHRTKVVGHKVMPGIYGQQITVPVKAHSDEYIARCDVLYERCKELNRVGI
jgi:hypothetical protein